MFTPVPINQWPQEYVVGLDQELVASIRSVGVFLTQNASTSDGQFAVSCADIEQLYI